MKLLFTLNSFFDFNSRLTKLFFKNTFIAELKQWNTSRAVDSMPSNMNVMWIERMPLNLYTNGVRLMYLCMTL